MNSYRPLLCKCKHCFLYFVCRPYNYNSSSSENRLNSGTVCHVACGHDSITLTKIEVKNCEIQLTKTCLRNLCYGLAVKTVETKSIDA